MGNRTQCGDGGSSAEQAGSSAGGERRREATTGAARSSGPEPARGRVTHAHSEIRHCFSGVTCGAPGISWRGRAAQGDRGGQQAADTGQSCSWPSLAGQFQTRVGTRCPEGVPAAWQMPPRSASCRWLVGTDRTAATQVRAWSAAPRAALGASLLGVSHCS